MHVNRRVRWRAGIGTDILLCSGAAPQHQVVGPHTGWSAAAPPQPTAGWHRTDVQLPGKARSGHLSYASAVADRQRARSTWLVRSSPQPARFGALDVAPEALGERSPATRATRGARAAARSSRRSTAGGRRNEHAATGLAGFRKFRHGLSD